MEKTQEMLKDKDKMKEMEDSMKKRVEEGQKELEEFKKKNAELEEEEKKAAADLKVSVFFCLILIGVTYLYGFHCTASNLAHTFHYSPRISK